MSAIGDLIDGLNDDLREAERYIRDLERSVRALEPGATLTAIRAGQFERTGPQCNHCWGRKISFVVKRMTTDPEDDVAVEIPCPPCKGTGLPPQWVIEMYNDVNRGPGTSSAR